LRITTEKLLELARKEAEDRPGIVSGYVIGSAAGGDPVFGGTADVDLVLIHEYEPAVAREIVTLSDEVHLDISHHAKRLYEQPRELRVDPWLGPAMCEPVFLYDPNHFFEWAQASVRGQFHRPDYMLARGAAFLGKARLSLKGLETDRLWLSGWTSALLEAANAVASLDGFPASGRRVMPQLKSKLTELGHPEIYGYFLRSLGAEQFEDSMAAEWVDSWAAAFDSASKLSLDPELAEVRRGYYLGGFRAMIEEGSAVEILWPMLSTWDRAIHELGESQPHWPQILNTLELSADHAGERERELEDVLDQIEGILELWAEKVGA
jgi:hypothetical protein